MDRVVVVAKFVVVSTLGALCGLVVAMSVVEVASTLNSILGVVDRDEHGMVKRVTVLLLLAPCTIPTTLLAAMLQLQHAQR